MKFIPACIIAALTFVCLPSFSAAPVVTNVSATQIIHNVSGIINTTKLVLIRYDVRDDDNDPMRVRVEVSSDGGTLYSVPALTFTNFPALGYTNKSDIGENILSGTNKVIIWDAGKDWDGEYSTQMVVKVYAIDNIGFPDLAWGNEVASSGFLMGQDGGTEGSGPSRHVNIPWSYWLGKYEVRADEYASFLNMALVAGDVFRIETQVFANAFRFAGVPEGALLIQLGDNLDVRWNVNNFEVSGGRFNFPARVTWYGAMAFANYYGYDLPTEAEWEKAARGPDQDDEDEHLLYHWGDSISGSDANYFGSGDPFESFGPAHVGYYNGNQSPLGPDRANAYGLYDMAGNVIEWTRSKWLENIEAYPESESIGGFWNSVDQISERVLRGGSWWNIPEGSSLSVNTNSLSNFKRDKGDQDDYFAGRNGLDKPVAGFRVARRDNIPGEPRPSSQFIESFDGPSWPAGTVGAWTNVVSTGRWSGHPFTYRIQSNAVARSGPGLIAFSGVNSRLVLPGALRKPIGITLWTRAISSAETGTIQLYESNGSAWNQVGATINVSTGSYSQLKFDVSTSTQTNFMIFAYKVYIDDVQMFVKAP
jgi:formylglycine-generating enzyme required for sulfatase activity